MISRGSWSIKKNLAKQVVLATSSPGTLAGCGIPDGACPRLQGSLDPDPSAGRISCHAPALPCQCLSSLPRDRIQSSANCSNSANCASVPTPVTTAANERNDTCFWEPFDLHQSREQLLISDKGFDNFCSRGREILVTKSWFNHAAHHTDTALDVASKRCAINTKKLFCRHLKLC